MFDPEDIGSNPTNNPHLADIIDRHLSRRRLIGGAAAATFVGLFGSNALTSTATAGYRPANGDAREPGGKKAGKGQKGTLLGFAEVPPSSADTIVVPPGYVADVLIPWGTPLFSAVAPFAEDASNTTADQMGQVGFNHDGMHYFPLSPGNAGNGRGLLVLNHEYTDANQIYTAAEGSAIPNGPAGAEKVAKALAGHGVTVVEVMQQADGTWTHVVDSPYNRRVTGTTPMAFSGPVGLDDPRMVSTITPSPLGTLNNCAMGYTPWGTYLACEENWNGYFGTGANDAEADAWTNTARTPDEARYGVSGRGFAYNWHRAVPRFDLAVNRNELNHFGWVVEIDPFDPAATPVKRTALGRVKHEGATVTESNGRIVVYTGDDENGDYMYKFVGSRPWRQIRAQGGSPLDEGTLYVAKFSDTGSGQWLPLVAGVGNLTPANGFATQADVLLRTRQAADAAGATRLHRPEWVAVHPHTKEVYLALTNGTTNGAAPVNSGRNPNPYGHVIRWREDKDDNTSLAFSWDVFVFAGDPAYPSLEGDKVPDGQPIFGSPDGLWIDDDGRVWIQTDISNSSQNRKDTSPANPIVLIGYDNIKNNQMLAADPDTGEVRRFLTGPRGCEVTGVITTPDQRTMFVNIQHPGESTTFWNTPGPSTSNPKAVSSWPGGPTSGRPRPATVVIRKLDGGKIGT